MFELLILAAEASEPLYRNDFFIAAVAAAVSGVVVKLIEMYLKRGEIRLDEATELRNELREAARVRAKQLRDTQIELDLWKEKYYVLLRDHEELKLEVQMLKIRFNE